jgi:hypothetical protein
MEKQSHSPILPPSRVGLFKERSATPMAPPKSAPKKPSPKVEAKNTPLTMSSSAKKSPTVVRVASRTDSVLTEAPVKKAETVEISSDSEAESDENEQEDVAPVHASIETGMCHCVSCGAVPVFVSFLC